MPPAPTLTGQDIAEAQGAVSKLLEKSLAPTGTTRHEYVVLRVLVVRGPYPSPKALHDYLADQAQLGLTPSAVAELLVGLEERGLADGTALDSAGPARATSRGAALLTQLAEEVAPSTRALFADLDPAHLAIAHDVLAHLIRRADELAA